MVLAGCNEQSGARETTMKTTKRARAHDVLSCRRAAVRMLRDHQLRR
jgi:hypothetical protein